MADVFVSYSRKDRARVAPLVAAIEAKGWSVWWDPEIALGQEFDRHIAAELSAAAAVLVVWTPDSVESRWVRGEAREAADRGILVPVRFEGANLPIDVRAFHTTDFDGASDDARSPQVEEMLHALDALIARRQPLPSQSPKPDPIPPTPATGPARVAICVLPFTNMSGDPEQQFFSDGITEDIITELSRWRLLAVRSRSASFRYRGAAVDVKQVARELNVRFIVEGSVRRMGERIRISAQLIDTETGTHVWGEKFDRDLAEVFAVQDQLVQTIVSTLVGRVQVSDAERARRKPPASLAAYECVLEGNALPWDDPRGAAEAKRLFEKAIELDPGYGFAHALLAAMSYGKWHDDPSDSDAALQEAYDLAKRAVELDENESTCFSMLGQVCLLRRSFDLALQFQRRAIELNPGNQWNTADMGVLLTYLGQPGEALTWFNHAKEIDPFFDPPWYRRAMGQAFMSLGRYDEALAMFDQAPGRSYRIAALKAACHARLADMDHAMVCVAECLADKPDFSVGRFMAKEPFKNPADRANLAESLRMAGLPESTWVDEVIHFWFEELAAADWFSKDGELDAKIRERFLGLHERLMARDGQGIDGPRALLAAVIVLDQFSRNLFRGDPRAFAADSIARRLARTAIEQGFDRSMSKNERIFLYLPFEHSENRDDQALAVELVEALGDDEWTRFALAHKAIIDRFGRFPHRNAILGRVSTADELALLTEPMGSF